jgi:hypothetical protein
MQDDATSLPGGYRLTGCLPKPKPTLPAAPLAAAMPGPSREAIADAAVATAAASDDLEVVEPSGKRKASSDADGAGPSKAARATVTNGGKAERPEKEANDTVVEGAVIELLSSDDEIIEID